MGPPGSRSGWLFLWLSIIFAYEVTTYNADGLGLKQNAANTSYDTTTEDNFATTEENADNKSYKNAADNTSSVNVTTEYFYPATTLGEG